MTANQPIIIGQRFGRLLVIDYAPSRTFPKCGQTHRFWLCKCDCGTITEVRNSSLGGNTNSCGCLHREMLVTQNLTHGHARPGQRSKTYMVWTAMIARCTCKTNKSFKDYGGRGIKVCERWMKFENFLSDMGEKPKRLTLHRIENDGDYEPSNCRWDTMKVQARHRRNTRIFTVNGITACLSEHCEHFGLNYGTVSMRINKYKWAIERALMTPV